MQTDEPFVAREQRRREKGRPAGLSRRAFERLEKNGGRRASRQDERACSAGRSERQPHERLAELAEIAGANEPAVSLTELRSRHWCIERRASGRRESGLWKTCGTVVEDLCTRGQWQVFFA
jgi:hypothetical protein